MVCECRVNGSDYDHDTDAKGSSFTEGLSRILYRAVLCVPVQASVHAGCTDEFTCSPSCMEARRALRPGHS